MFDCIARNHPFCEVALSVFGVRICSLLKGKVELQVEISNPWRYAVIIAARWMTHKNTRHKN